MLNINYSTTMKILHIYNQLISYRTAVIILITLSSSYLIDMTDSTVTDRHLTKNTTVEQTLHTFKRTYLPNSVKSELKPKIVMKNPLDVHQTDNSNGYKHISSGAFVTDTNDGHEVHSTLFTKVSVKALVANGSSSKLESNNTDQRRKPSWNPQALNFRKKRSVHTTGESSNNHTTPKLLPTTVKVEIISPTPVLRSPPSDRGGTREQYESPQEIQDDKNEDMLQLLQARGFSYTVLPHDMMSRHPDIVMQVELDEMEGPGHADALGHGKGKGHVQGQIGGGHEQGHNKSQGHISEGQGRTGNHQRQTGDGQVTDTPDSEGSDNDGKDTEGPEEEENELGDSDGDNDQAESPESSNNRTESESANSTDSEHDEHWEDDLQPSMTAVSGGSTDSPHHQQEDYLDYDYAPYYHQPDHTALAGSQDHFIATHQIHKLPNMAATDSGINSGPIRSGPDSGHHRSGFNSGTIRSGPDSEHGKSKFNSGPKQPGIKSGPNRSGLNSGQGRSPGVNSGPKRPGLNSGNGRPDGFKGTRKFDAELGQAGMFLPMYQHNNATGQQGAARPGQRHQINGSNPGQAPPAGFLPMHQLHNIGNTHTGQTNPGAQPNPRAQPNSVASSSVPVRTANTGLPPSTIFGIVAGCIIGSWMVLGPLICLLCKFRDARQEKRKRFSPRLYHSDSNNGITEAMIMSELGREPIKLQPTNYKQRDSMYSERSDTYHDAYETPALLL